MSYEEALRLCEEALELLKMGAGYGKGQLLFAGRNVALGPRQQRDIQTSGESTELEEQMKAFLGHIDLAIAETQELIRRYKAMSDVEEIDPNELAEKIEALIADIRKVLNQTA